MAKNGQVVNPTAYIYIKYNCILFLLCYLAHLSLRQLGLLVPNQGQDVESTTVIENCTQEFSGNDLRKISCQRVVSQSLALRHFLSCTATDVKRLRLAEKICRSCAQDTSRRLRTLVNNCTWAPIFAQKFHAYLNSVQQMVSGELAGSVSRQGSKDTVYPLRELRWTQFTPQKAPKQCPANGVRRILWGLVSRHGLLDTVKKHMDFNCAKVVLAQFSRNFGESWLRSPECFCISFALFSFNLYDTASCTGNKCLKCHPHTDNSETGRIRFQRVRFQTPNSVSFFPSPSSRENSASSSQPMICVPKRTHRVFRRAHWVCPRTQWGSVSSLLQNSTVETVFRPFPNNYERKK